MIYILPTYLQTHLSGPNRGIFYLAAEERNDTMKFPVVQWAYFLVPIASVNPSPCSLPLPSTAFIQIRATLVPAHVHARTISPFPPQPSTRNYTQPNEPGKNIWISVRGVAAFYLSAYLACLIYLQCWSWPNMSLVLVCVYTEYWSHIAGSAAPYFLFLFF